MNERIEIQTLTDGGQQPPDVARMVAAFLAGATQTLDLAQYDFNLTGEAKDIVVEGDHGRGEPRREDPVRLQRRPREPDPGAAAAGAGRPADRDASRAGRSDRRRSRPDAPQVRDPRRHRRLDRLAELDERLVDAAGERDRDRPLGGDREGVPHRLRPVGHDTRCREERLRRPALGRRCPCVVHAGPRRGPLVPHRENNPPLEAPRAHLLPRDHDRPGARHARGGDRRREARSRRMRRRDADSRGDPSVDRRTRTFRGSCRCSSR